MGRYDGWDLASPSSVHRAMARRGLLQPVRYQAERRQLAAARREVFVDPPARRNRVWQVDFSAFETTSEGREPGSSAVSSRTPPNWLWRPRHSDPDRRRPDLRPRGRRGGRRGAARAPTRRGLHRSPTVPV